MFVIVLVKNGKEIELQQVASEEEGAAVMEVHYPHIEEDESTKVEIRPM